MAVSNETKTSVAAVKRPMGWIWLRARGVGWAVAGVSMAAGVGKAFWGRKAYHRAVWGFWPTERSV